MKRSDLLYKITCIIDNKADDLGFFLTEELAEEILNLIESNMNNEIKWDIE